MEYLILNEESIPFSSRADCNKYLPLFFDIILKSFRNMQCVRLSENLGSGWYNFEIAENYYLREWINIHEFNYRIKLKTIINKTKTPQIPVGEVEIIEKVDLSEFSLITDKKIETPSLGSAYLLNQIALSFRSKEYWNLDKIELNRITLKCDSVIEEKTCRVSNIANMIHWNYYLGIIQEERKESYKKGNDLWENRKTEFPNLKFCKSTKNTFMNLNINNATFNSLWKNLNVLNDNICNCSSKNELKKETQLSFTDESDCVKNKPNLRRHREFVLPNGCKKFFGLHIKNFPGFFRLHFLPDFPNNIIYIGYFGKHLKTC